MDRSLKSGNRSRGLSQFSRRRRRGPWEKALSPRKWDCPPRPGSKLEIRNSKSSAARAFPGRAWERGDEPTLSPLLAPVGLGNRAGRRLDAVEPRRPFANHLVRGRTGMRFHAERVVARDCSFRADREVQSLTGG